jgi:hypothetical protein
LPVILGEGLQLEVIYSYLVIPEREHMSVSGIIYMDVVYAGNAGAISSPSEKTVLLIWIPGCLVVLGPRNDGYTTDRHSVVSGISEVSMSSSGLETSLLISDFCFLVRFFIIVFTQPA